MLGLSGHDRKRSIWVDRRSHDEGNFPTKGTLDSGERGAFVLRTSLPHTGMRYGACNMPTIP